MRVVGILAVGVLLLAVIASGIAVVWARHQDRAAFVALSKLQNQRDALNVEFGRLELEQATWASPSRIEQIARGQLGMISPPAASVEMIRE
ncbi:MAG: cell division protein FtsL [Xanthomonadales bacterium]|nr:cell division protein FtsL [Xanthomonadales bacterium]ODU94392.1 MAG: cell division protein FtsL [Rhodanobacter sp. SCN 66-43]OJY86999.1 MAG: cell division protein FtsL [Xanthomonadales bacterium 66-474]